MSDRPPVELTRERLEAALFYFRGGTYNADHLRIIVAAAERLLAPPASDEELTTYADEWNDEFHGSSADDEVLYAYRDGIRNTERRLLLPADETGGGQ